jgi:hypothetical protein
VSTGGGVVLDDATRRALVAAAARAPSVHNVQPARWRFDDDGRVMLLRALDRALPVADPSGHDVRVSLGAAWEGMALALSERGLTLGVPRFGVSSGGSGADGLEPVAEAAIEAGGEADPLAAVVERRRSYRGTFAPTPTEALRALGTIGDGDLIVITDRSAIDAHAALHDRASYALVSRPAYEAELYGWMRFSPRHPGWDRDGLNADCMALSRVERVAASVLLRPNVYRVVRAVGAGKALISEARQIRSAGAVVLFVPERALPDFDVGRRFYRRWLEIARIGLAVTPLSALADWPESNAHLASRYGVPPVRRIANVLRVGVPGAEPARSPRLTVAEMLG